MSTNETQELLTKLQEELKDLKETHPEEYLELLKTLNRGVDEIASDLEKALKPQN